MTQEKIIEGNKLIAEFMGFPTKQERLLFSGGFVTEDRRLEYYTSWDWLMPVLENLVSLNPKEGKEYYYYSMSYCHCRIWANGAFGIIWEQSNNSDETIKAAWYTVIDFINWYNLHNPSTPTNDTENSDATAN